MSELNRRDPPPKRTFWTARMPRGLAMLFGITTADAEFGGRIRAAQVSSILRLTPVAMIASCLNGAILLFTLGRAHRLTPGLLIWSLLLLALALNYARSWIGRDKRDPNRPVSHRAIRRAALHGVLFGALWGAVPLMAYPGAPPEIQLFIGCLTSGMICAGAFVLGAVPIAGLAFIAMVAGGGIIALLRSSNPIDPSLIVLLGVYTVVIVVNLTWNAQLFVDHFLAEARLQAANDARERTQGQVAHAQRMAALGQLAGGIAHDFNNILQAVAGSAVSIANRAQDGGQVRHLSARILEAAERGGAISRRLLAFAHQDTLSAEIVDPVELMRAAHELLRPTFDASIGIRLEVPKGLPSLLADRSQLDTVLVNLTANARDAMPYGGDLTLSVARDVVVEDIEEPALKAGAYLRIRISDTGSGTGLGLSMAKGFAEQSGGALAIASTPGRGTTVTLWLPQADARTDARARGLAESRNSPATSGTARERHILLVDDDELVRETMIESLTPYGCRISVAENAQTALDLIDGGAPVDVVVSDFSMPGMNGIDLIRAARARRPGLAAILLTGHVGDIAAAEGDGNDFTLLRKPIRAADLVRCFVAAVEA
jgi:signal transduction histidine kinase/CheY-like chemotaxis protein